MMMMIIRGVNIPHFEDFFIPIHLHLLFWMVKVPGGTVYAYVGTPYLKKSLSLYFHDHYRLHYETYIEKFGKCEHIAT